jgi:hypothetical protein
MPHTRSRLETSTESAVGVPFESKHCVALPYAFRLFHWARFSKQRLTIATFATTRLGQLLRRLSPSLAGAIDYAAVELDIHGRGVVRYFENRR